MKTQHYSPIVADARDVVLSMVGAINDLDFARARTYAHPDMQFAGVLGSRDGADAYFKDMERMKLQYNIKRFKIETTTLRNKFLFIKEGDGNQLEAVTTNAEPVLAIQSGRGAQIRKARIKVNKMVEVMGWKAVGAKLADYSKSTTMEWEKQKNEEDNQPELFG